MDEFWNNQILEFGAVNITGFRILNPNRYEYIEFMNSWKNLDKYNWPNSGIEYISV